MTSKEAVKLAYTEFQKDFDNGEETNQWLTDVIEGLKQAEKDLKILEILKSNIIDEFFQYGSLYDDYNIETITIQVKQPKKYIEKIDGKEIHYTPCKTIHDNDFELLIDMLKEKELLNETY